MRKTKLIFKKTKSNIQSHHGKIIVIGTVVFKK